MGQDPNLFNSFKYLDPIQEKHSSKFHRSFHWRCKCTKILSSRCWCVSVFKWSLGRSAEDCHLSHLFLEGKTNWWLRSYCNTWGLSESLQNFYCMLDFEKSSCLKSALPKEQAWSLTKLRSENSGAAHKSWRFSCFHLSFRFQLYVQVRWSTINQIVADSGNWSQKPNGFGCQKSGSIWAQRIVDTVGLFAPKTKIQVVQGRIQEQGV